MAVAVLRNPALRSESARRHAMLASTLAAMARALVGCTSPTSFQSRQIQAAA
jgi:hypothetical protein